MTDEARERFEAACRDAEFYDMSKAWKVWQSAVRDTRERCAKEWINGLKNHWLTEIICHHDASTDQALCFCGWRGNELLSVGEAVGQWIGHVAERIRQGDGK